MTVRGLPIESNDFKTNRRGQGTGPDPNRQDNIVRETGIFPDGLIWRRQRGHRRVTKPWVHVTKVPPERKDDQERAAKSGSRGQPR